MTAAGTSDAPADWECVKVVGRAGTTNHYQFPTPKSSTSTIDKSLACMALWNAECKAVRVCAPPRLGKTMMMSTLRAFFCVVTPRDMPGSLRGDQATFDSAAARANRMGEFGGSLLCQRHPEFFDAHFGCYPVISLQFNILPTSTFQGICRSVALHVMSELSSWASAIDRDGLDTKQLAVLDEAAEIIQAVKTSVYRASVDRLKGLATEMFTLLSKVLEHVYRRRFILLIDGYDEPLIAAANRSWADDVRSFYIETLGLMLRDKMLEKALLAGTYPVPLGSDGSLDMENMATVSLGINGAAEHLGPGAQQPTGFVAVLGTMYGYTERGLLEIMDSDRSFLKASPARIANVEGVLVDTFGGYNFGDGRRCCATSDVVQAIQALMNPCNDVPIRFVNGPSASAADLKAGVRRLALEHRGLMVLLASHVLDSFDTGEPSCFIGPPEKADGMRHFTLDPACRLAGFDTKCAASSIVTMLLHAGYLTVGTGGSLQIPNLKHRALWEHIRLAATFGTLDPVEQGTGRHELADSLRRGVTIVLMECFDTAMTELFDTASDYSEHERVELACRLVLSTLQQPCFGKPERHNVTYSRLFFEELRHGWPAWEIVLHPLGRYTSRLALVIVLQPVAAPDANSEAVDRIALEAAQAAADRSLLFQLGHGDARLNIGIAVGCGKLGVRHR